jgi:hypothetical protein
MEYILLALVGLLFSAGWDLGMKFMRWRRRRKLNS